MLLLIIMALLCNPGMTETVFARTWQSANGTSGHVVVMDDMAELFDDEQAQQILEVMGKAAAFCNVFFVSNQEEYTGSVSSYAKAQLGRLSSEYQADKRSSTVFVVDLYNRELYIYSGEETYKVITSAKANLITDNVYSYASKGDYFQCTMETFRQIALVLDGQAIAEPMRYATAGFLAVFTGMAVSFVIILLQSRRKTATEQEMEPMFLVSECDTDLQKVLTKTTRTRHHEGSSGSGGSGGGGGGGFSGGGGGGHSF